MKNLKIWIAASISLGFCANVADAAEGASSNYFPGAYGSSFVAVAPEPGPVLTSVNLFFSGTTDFAVRQGRVDTSISAGAFYTLAQGYYVWGAPEIGGRFAISGYVPFGYSKIEADLETQLGHFAFEDDESGLGDIGIIPASFYWNMGNFHFNLYELIIAPTGIYNVGDKVFVGRNYWSFDTVFATTWFDPDSGTELSAAGGIMFNTKNKATNYRTGTEFHLDLVTNHFVTEEFGVGLRGYIYHQLTGDTGAGAILGDFRSKSAGGGLGFSWIPKSAGGKFSVSATWIHDLYAKRRLKADYISITPALTF